MKMITLEISGREMTFSESELIEILERYYESKKKELKCFEVIPGTINQELFSTKRKDVHQEEIRQIILEAFTKVNEEPEKYGRPFNTMIPEKTWLTSKSIKEMEELATELGDHIADWVEQALVWAQRISNGETWESICDTPDTENWYRVVFWKNGHYRVVGGARFNYRPASYINYYNCNSDDELDSSVPLIVFYDQELSTMFK